MADSRDDEVPELKAETSDTSERQKDFTRRALLRAGWVVPVVTAIDVRPAAAQSPPPHNDTHLDTPHVDEIVIHADTHLDSTVPTHDDHSDTTPHGDHSDAATHLDSHGDSHADHGDHTDAHSDDSFNDHTDAGHTDHVDDAFHHDH